MEQIVDVAPMVQLLDLPEPRVVDQLVEVFKTLYRDSQEIAVRKTSFDLIPPRTVLLEPQVAEQLVEVPVLVPSFNDWIRREETYRATGYTWLGGLVPDPFDGSHRQPRAENKYWARISSTSLVSCGCSSSTPSFTSSSSAAWPAGVGQHLCLRLLARRTG